MGRAPCCDKANVKKGPWSPEEDAKLKAYIEQHGTGGNWIALPQKIGLKRCGKSCRLRWLNYLRPNIKHGGFSEEEDNIICSLYISIGSRWSIIAAQLPGRTDNDIKNYWNTRLKKKLLGKQRKEIQARRNRKPTQEMRKDRDNHMVSSDNNNQNPYWPELPVLPPIPYSTEEPLFNDHTSIRKLLIKLGGRFSSDDQPINGLANLQYPVLDTSFVQPLYQQQLNMLSSSPVDVLNSASLPGTEYKMNEVDHTSMLTAPSSFTSELEQMICNNPQKFDGLEFLCGDISMNNRIAPTCGGSSGWGEMSPLLLPSVALNYEGQQAALQACAADHLRYPGP